MRYFMDTHDKTKGSFPAEELTEAQFSARFDALEAAGHELDVFGHAAHVNLNEGKAFCFMSGPDEDAIRKAHAAIDFPFDSITEVRRVTGADMRPSRVGHSHPREDKTMSVKLLVLYPSPTDPEQFDRRYEREHLPMGKSALVGATGLASHRILGSPAGKSPFARLTEVSFPTLKALQECAALPGAQKTMAHAVEISTGGIPHFMIVEQEG